MRERIFVILRKEFLQAFREPRMRVMLFIPPIMQIVIFGYAVSLDVNNARIAWMDMDNTPASRALRASFDASDHFRIVAEPRTERETQDVLDHAEATGVVRVLPGFARDLARNRTAEVQVLLDGSDSNTASIVSGYAAGIIARYSADVSESRPRIRMTGGGPGPAVAAESRVWFNPELRSRNYFVPGTAANIILMITFMLTAQAIIREKEIGTMEQLMVTPIRPIELMLGKTLPFALVGLVDMALVTGAAMLLFDLPFRGSMPLLFFCAALFLMTSLGAGLFMSTISRTQQQANMASFFFTMPAFMLSGFTFPIHNMPLIVQYLTYLNPLRYFMEIVRGIFIKGAGVEALWPQMVCLFVYGVVVLGLSAARFQKTLD